jgi:putative salt-induced outer membrane protein
VPGLLVLILALHALIATTPVIAQAVESEGSDSEDGLTRAELDSIAAAVARNDVVTIHAIVIAAIVRETSDPTAVVRDAVRAAPEQADSIVAAVSSSFPGLAERVAGVLEEERAKPARAPPPREKALPRPGQRTMAEKIWSGETSVGGTLQSGKSDTATANVDARVVHRAAPWTHIGRLDFDYGSADDQTKTYRARLTGRIRRDLTERLYFLGQLDYENDRFSGFEYQTTESVGLGYRVFDLPDFTLDVEGGPALRQSKVEETGAIDHEVLARLGLNLDWSISDTARFTNETTVFASKDAVDIESVSGAFVPDSSESKNLSALELRIIGDLTARLSFELRYRSDPPPGGVSTTTITKFGIVHRF